MSQTEDFPQLLARKFPDMKPVKRNPVTMSIYGFGLSMSGRRDFDAETGTYVKTHCITALFIPLLALGAYRVADADNGGWYLLGKVDRSGFAKFWSLVVIACIAAMVATTWWSAHTSSPEYRAARSLEKAAEHVAAGESLMAASVFSEMIADDLPSKTEAKTGLENAIAEAMGSDSADTVLSAIKMTAGFPAAKFGRGEIVPEMSVLVGRAVGRFADADPEVSLKILKASEELPKQPEDLAERQQALLERLVKDQPDQAGYAIELAGIYEASGRVDESFALLEPLADQLGTGEGARILGQVFLAKGRAAEAAVLLESYIEPRLKKWRGAETRYQTAAQQAYDRIIDRLNDNKGPRSFYSAYEKANNEEEQNRLVDEYVFDEMQNDSRYQAAGRDYEEAGDIVPVIMDLGISELQAAQGAADAAQRKELLDKAEEHFLLLENTAGGTDEFNYLLGQVYYWSGRQDEGRALFDELLASSGRSYQTLMALSSSLREIGNVSEARSLAEEAFGKAADQDEKNNAAGQRSIMSIDLDDKVSWLEKIDSTELFHLTQLAGARADQAINRGDTAEAIKQLRVAEDGWAKLPVSSSTLNNGALVQLRLFEQTGDLTYREAGSRMLQRAVTLEPDSSILLGNAATSLAGTAMMQVGEGKLHPRIIQEGVSFDALRYLYRDQASYDEVVAEITANKNYQSAMELYERALLLAPNSKELYQAILAYYGFARDYEALDRVALQLESARLDHSDSIDQFIEFREGEDDETLREDLSNGLKHHQEILTAVGDDEAQRRHVLAAMAELRLSLFSIGELADYNKEIAFLRKAQAEAPCSRYSGILVDALAQKACVGLAEKNPAFARLLASFRRFETARGILILALTSDELASAVLANADASAALAEELRTDDLFPATRNAESVVLTGRIAPERLDAAQRQFAENRRRVSSERTRGIIAPWHPSTVASRYMVLVAEGKMAEAKAVIEKARVDDIAVPEL